jgi:hypothetical protein
MDHDIFEHVEMQRDVTHSSSFAGWSGTKVGPITSTYRVNVRYCNVLPFEYVYRGVLGALNEGHQKVTVRIGRHAIMSLGSGEYAVDYNYCKDVYERELYSIVKKMLEDS